MTSKNAGPPIGARPALGQTPWKAYGCTREEPAVPGSRRTWVSATRFGVAERPLHPGMSGWMPRPQRRAEQRERRKADRRMARFLRLHEDRERARDASRVGAAK